jgi:hypothetical protein
VEHQSPALPSSVGVDWVSVGAPRQSVDDASTKYRMSERDSTLGGQRHDEQLRLN